MEMDRVGQVPAHSAGIIDCKDLGYRQATKDENMCVYVFFANQTIGLWGSGRTGGGVLKSKSDRPTYSVLPLSSEVHCMVLGMTDGLAWAETPSQLRDSAGIAPVFIHYAGVHPAMTPRPSGRKAHAIV